MQPYSQKTRILVAEVFQAARRISARLSIDIRKRPAMMAPASFPISICCAKPALFSGLGKVHLQFTVTQGIGIEHADGFVGFALGAHRDEAKALGLAASTILDDIDQCNVSSLPEQRI